MSIAIIYSDEYLKHDTGNHPERPQRYRATLDGLMADEDLWSDLVKIAPRPATDEELRRCHTERAVQRVEQACSQATLYDHVSLDADTVVSHYSEVAARLAAGGACRAVEAVLGGEAETAFVACRPPGHHATVGRAMGFCLYNNVAVAARYAQAAYPGRIKEVLIVDFDVHHGNGTQDIFYDDPTVFYYSLHQYPWYPGTGDAGERGAREGEGYTLNIPVPAMTPAEDYMRLFEEGLESVMRNFSPDLVVISAGFDAHEADPLGQLLLNDASYERMTRRLKEAASTNGEGRIVSCLEGGYNLRALSDAARAHVRAML
ncbi:MAG TPA: histone deacetylase [Blastocatellia bacterium]|jgi:acetoin utilization deacetylase AcuC-like enzyme|nr:histone deacetylase [Blastocatellia bacterium]